MNSEQNWIVFDAAGTLIHVQPSVSQAYVDVASQLGFVASSVTIRDRLGPAWKNWFSIDKSPTNDEDQLLRWKGLVSECFSELSSDDIEKLFPSLWNHFKSPSAWRLDEDIPFVFNWLIENKWKLVIASNFDQRLPDLISQIPHLDQIEHVFYSAQIGWSKPNHRFYLEIEKQIAASKSRVVMVGDTWLNDCQAPREVGWQAVWLDPSQNTSTGSANNQLHNNTLEWSLGTKPIKVDESISMKDNTIGRLRDLPKWIENYFRPSSP